MPQLASAISAGSRPSATPIAIAARRVGQVVRLGEGELEVAASPAGVAISACHALADRALEREDVAARAEA